MAEATRPVSVLLVQGMLLRAQKLLFHQISHALTKFCAWIRGGTGLCSLVWSQRKFSGIWKGKKCKQRAIPGAARALGHTEEALLQAPHTQRPAARSAADAAAREKCRGNFSIPSRYALSKMLEKMLCWI